MRFIFLFIGVTAFYQLSGQSIKDYKTVSFDGFDFPVLVRGNMESGKIILFVQGGPGETAIDFARADYPKWKNTIEEEYAIAYYDQRGLNISVDEIDSASITSKKYADDIRYLSEWLKKQYEAQIYLMGHSYGGRFVLHALDGLNNNNNPISGAIIVNTPFTNSYDDRRYKYFRPLYLKNLAQEKIDAGIDQKFWSEAKEWMIETDSIYSSETSRQWNHYVDQAFRPTKRKITPGMVFKTVFSRPYNPFKYLNRNDNERVSDLLWYNEKNEKKVIDMQIDVPVLFLTGRYDDIAPPEEIRQFHDQFEDSEMIIIPKAGHESFIDQPEMFVESIRSFLK